MLSVEARTDDELELALTLEALLFPSTGPETGGLPCTDGLDVAPEVSSTVFLVLSEPFWAVLTWAESLLSAVSVLSAPGLQFLSVSESSKDLDEEVLSLEYKGRFVVEAGGSPSIDFLFDGTTSWILRRFGDT